MPILKKEDVLPERPVIVVIYGTPGSGKSSMATTAKNPIMIDTDRGCDRACRRCD
ncbi:MAG: AAA family ATPase, partial [Bacteroidaceae bacterium]